MENATGKQFLTDQYAIVSQGTNEKPWPFHACSNSKFTETELTRYTEALRKDNIRLPSRKYLNARVESIHKIFNTSFTEDSLQQKFAKQRAIELKYDPANAARLKREAIEKRRAAAELDNDLDELAKCDSELAALENSGPASNGSTTTSAATAIRPKPSPAKNNHAAQDRLAQLNHKNRVKNVEEVRRALLEEKRKLKRDREAAMAKRIGEAQLAKKTGATDDLFGETPGGSRGSTPATGGAVTPRAGGSRAGTPLLGAVKKEAGGPLGALKKKAMDDDVIGSLDLGIDIEI